MAPPASPACLPPPPVARMAVRGARATRLQTTHPPDRPRTRPRGCGACAAKKALEDLPRRARPSCWCSSGDARLPLHCSCRACVTKKVLENIGGSAKLQVGAAVPPGRHLAPAAPPGAGGYRRPCLGCASHGLSTPSLSSRQAAGLWGAGGGRPGALREGGPVLPGRRVRWSHHSQREPAVGDALGQILHPSPLSPAGQD